MAQIAELKKRCLNVPTTARCSNPHLSDEDVQDELVLVAVNNGDAYRDGKNAKRAVEAAMKDYRENMEIEMSETFDIVRAKAIKEVARQWRRT